MKKLALILIYFFIPLICDADPAQDLMKNLNAYQKVQGKFSQVLYDQSGNPQLQSNGNFALDRPETASKTMQGKFYWETQKPNAQLLIADGQKIWFYDPSLQQVTVQKQQNLATQNSPALLLSGNLTQLSAQYVIHEASTSSQNIFTLLPQKETFFSKIQLIFTEVSKMPSLTGMIIFDNLGQKTQIQFSNLLPLGKDAENLFKFKTPPGVDVVEG